MKLAYLTSSFPFGGTSEVFFLPEIREMRRRGHHLLVIPAFPRGTLFHRDAAALLDATRVVPLVCREVLATAFRVLASKPGRVLALLVEALGARNAFEAARNLAGFPKALWLADLVQRERVEHIYCQWSGPTATMAMIAGELTGVPWSFTAHRGDIVANNLLGLKIERAAMARFIARRGIGLMRELKVEFREDKPEVIPMGVDLPARPAASFIPGHAEAVPVVLCPARLVKLKGHVYLLRAAARLQARGIAFEIWLAGSGELDAPLRAEARSLGVERRVKFLGNVPHAELLGFYREGRIAVVALPSFASPNGQEEGIPVALMEPMAFGIPVVSTDAGGILELLEGSAGLVVPQRDAEALASAIERLLTDVDLRRRIGQAGRRRIEERFAVERVVDILLDRLARLSSPRAACGERVA